MLLLVVNWSQRSNLKCRSISRPMWQLLEILQVPKACWRVRNFCASGDAQSSQEFPWANCRPRKISRFQKRSAGFWLPHLAVPVKTRPRFYQTTYSLMYCMLLTGESGAEAQLLVSVMPCSCISSRDPKREGKQNDLWNAAFTVRTDQIHIQAVRQVLGCASNFFRK